MWRFIFLLPPMFLSFLSTIHADMIPFEFRWDETAAPAVDMSQLLDAPAGKHGFVSVQQGQMRWDNGERLRINAVRFHHPGQGLGHPADRATFG